MPTSVIYEFDAMGICSLTHFIITFADKLYILPFAWDVGVGHLFPCHVSYNGIPPQCWDLYSTGAKLVHGYANYFSPSRGENDVSMHRLFRDLYTIISQVRHKICV